MAQAKAFPEWRFEMTEETKSAEEIAKEIVYELSTTNSVALSAYNRLVDLISAAIKQERSKQCVIPEINQDTSDGYHTFKELYEHRVLLWINLCLTFPDKCFWRPHYEGWPLLGMETESGQITYHMQEKYLPLFKDKIKQGGPEWDGHTSNDVVLRLEKLAIEQIKKKMGE